MRIPNGRSFSRTALGPAAILLCSVSAWFLAGCAMAPYTDTSAHTLNISGTSFGGQPPVTGASITLFATGSTGYGSAPSEIGSTTTDGSGNFQITNLTGCPPGSQIYIVSTGGNPGLTAGTNNNALVLVAALGDCASVGASTHVILNEVTTIAAAYALSGFSGVGTVSFPVQIGASSTNASGFQHAFMNAANIVDFTGGSARATTPGGNGTVPYQLINSLADILEPCVNSTSKTSAACTTLFTNSHPPAGTGVAVPVNTWQAALDMAQYPGNNTAALYGLISATPSFQPTMGATAPNDLSIGITYTAGLASDGTTSATNPWGIAADANDNIWITGMVGTGLVELSSIGNVLSGNGGVGNSTLKAASTGQVAVDTHGNILTVDANASGGSFYQYIPGSGVTNVTTAAQLGVTIGLAGLAVDKNNNVWYSTASSTASAESLGELTYNSGTNAYTAVAVPAGTHWR